ncbi:hypothetical protein VTO42DRAFT_2890 [Malbranchea cinnamomea]
MGCGSCVPTATHPPCNHAYLARGRLTMLVTVCNRQPNPERRRSRSGRNRQFSRSLSHPLSFPRPTDDSRCSGRFSQSCSCDSLSTGRMTQCDDTRSYKTHAHKHTLMTLDYGLATKWASEEKTLGKKIFFSFTLSIHFSCECAASEPSQVFLPGQPRTDVARHHITMDG